MLYSPQDKLSLLHLTLSSVKSQPHPVSREYPGHIGALVLQEQLAVNSSPARFLFICEKSVAFSQHITNPSWLMFIIKRRRRRSRAGWLVYIPSVTTSCAIAVIPQDTVLFAKSKRLGVKSVNKKGIYTRVYLKPPILSFYTLPYLKEDHEVCAFFPAPAPLQFDFDCSRDSKTLSRHQR